jgi:hypothetical protein
MKKIYILATAIIFLFSGLFYILSLEETNAIESQIKSQMENDTKSDVSSLSSSIDSLFTSEIIKRTEGKSINDAIRFIETRLQIKPYKEEFDRTGDLISAKYILRDPKKRLCEDGHDIVKRIERFEIRHNGNAVDFVFIPQSVKIH